ncbi:hypothetical protein Y032_0065g3619 [Ancylostoma ceylanicum]|uniref:Uncharacterized protein n=1 Tax=Ancylostoma ceylanicum TaxID=53326 RepID=A0A016U0H9_9BILA|nr:hypothetical protein Y032_0065g3619 [Ancylostoma ceylanicum]
MFCVSRSHRVKRWGGYGYGYGYGRGFYPRGGGFYPGGGGYYPGGGGFYPGGGGFGNRWGSSVGLSASLRLGGFNNGYLFG